MLLREHDKNIAENCRLTAGEFVSPALMGYQAFSIQFNPKIENDLTTPKRTHNVHPEKSNFLFSFRFPPPDYSRRKYSLWLFSVPCYMLHVCGKMCVRVGSGLRSEMVMPTVKITQRLHLWAELMAPFIGRTALKRALPD